MKSKKVRDSGLARMHSLLRQEEGSLTDDDFLDVDSDEQTDVVDSPVPEPPRPAQAAPITSPVKPKRQRRLDDPSDPPCVIADKFCDRFGIPHGSKLTMMQFGDECSKANMKEFRETGKWPVVEKKKHRKAA